MGALTSLQERVGLLGVKGVLSCMYLDEHLHMQDVVLSVIFIVKERLGERELERRWSALRQGFSERQSSIIFFESCVASKFNGLKVNKVLQGGVLLKEEQERFCPVTAGLVVALVVVLV
jgi:hypothetical protein